MGTQTMSLTVDVIMFDMETQILLEKAGGNQLCSTIYNITTVAKGSQKQMGETIKEPNACMLMCFRLDPRESNFYVDLTAKKPPRGMTWCECKGTTFDNCEWELNDFQAFRQSGEDIAKQFQGQGRFRRSLEDPWYTDDIMDYEEKSFFIDEEDAQFAFSRIRSKRSISTFAMSKDNATSYCKHFVEDSTAGKMCSEVPGFNVTSAMKDCITDLQVTIKSTNLFYM